MILDANSRFIIRKAEQGDAGYVAYMHGKLYKTRYHLGGTVEYYFMKTLTDFVYNPEGSGLWVAETDGKIIGSIGIVSIDSETAQLRWFLVDETYHNLGIGSRLTNIALNFCRELGYKKVFLWTFRGLDSARYLYEKLGFIMTEEKPNTEWREDVVIEQKWEMVL